jgi:hypothetical protein
LARKVVVALVDDLDGSPAAETVQFGIDGRFYEVDLSGEHAAMLRRRLRPFVEAARRVDRRVPPARRVTAADPALSERNRRIRFWARQRGMSVPAQGRIPAGVAEAYQRELLGWPPE